MTLVVAVLAFVVVVAAAGVAGVLLLFGLPISA